MVKLYNCIGVGSVDEELCFYRYCVLFKLSWVMGVKVVILPDLKLYYLRYTP